MLRHWLDDFNDYAIFCDCKRNRDPQRLKVLQRCLDASILSSTVSRIQAVRSNESVLIQLANVLTGIASARLNSSLRTISAKNVLCNASNIAWEIPFGTHSGKAEINVFVINLQGGW